MTNISNLNTFTGRCGHTVRNVEPHLQDCASFECRDCADKAKGRNSATAQTVIEARRGTKGRRMSA